MVDRRPSGRRGLRLRGRDRRAPRPRAPTWSSCASRAAGSTRGSRTSRAAPGGKNRDLKLGQVNWRNLDTVREDELRRSVARPRRARRAHARLRRGRARPCGLRPARRAHRGADPDASAGGHPAASAPMGSPATPTTSSSSRAVRAAYERAARAAGVRGRHRGGPGRLARREALRPRRAAVSASPPSGRGAGRGLWIRRPSRRWRSSSVSSPS